MKIITESMSTARNYSLLGIFVSENSWEEELSQFLLDNSAPAVASLKRQDFKGSAKSVVHVATADKSIFVVGLGKHVNTDVIRMSAAQLIRSVKSIQEKELAILLNPLEEKQMSVQALVEGFCLGGYQYSKYKSEPQKVTVEQVSLLSSDENKSVFDSAIAQAQIYSEATLFARDLINQSPSQTTPTFLAETAQSLKSDVVSVEVMEKSDAEKMGMNAFLAVSKGSDEAPKFVKLTYNGGGKKIVVAGKAITFDSGGLSLKDAKNMETMKLDMSGAAAVLGLFKALSILKPKVTVIGLIAACENMPGPKAMKPGDVVKAMNGKTIEILNTDAEGRLTLADVLSYGALEKPDYMVDLATLTGACMVALGDEIAGLFSNNDDLSKKLESASAISGEKIWRLPMPAEYKELIKSAVADIDNIGKTRYGGAITAALFLQEFVGETAWAHLDIAGPAFSEKDVPLTPKGGVGFGVRMLLELIAAMD